MKEGLKTKALVLGRVERDQVTIFREGYGEDGGARHASVLSAVQQIADCEKGVSEKDEIFKKALLGGGPTTVIELEHEHMMLVEVLTEALEQEAQEGMLLELLHGVRELVLRRWGACVAVPWSANHRSW